MNAVRWLTHYQSNGIKQEGRKYNKDPLKINFNVRGNLGVPVLHLIEFYLRSMYLFPHLDHCYQF